MSQSGPRLTAAQVILLAGDDLMAHGAREFTEWDLTVAAWARSARGSVSAATTRSIPITSAS